MIRVTALLALTALLSGCAVIAVPSQDDPTCSWDSAVPKSAETDCRLIFRTVSSMVAAQQRGDEQAIARLAPAAPAARRITAESRSLRRQHAQGLHVVPSLTLRQRKPGTYDAQYFLLGKTPSGQINMQEAVIVRVHGQQALIVGSRPGVVNDQSGEG